MCVQSIHDALNPDDNIVKVTVLNGTLPEAPRWPTIKLIQRRHSLEFCVSGFARSYRTYLIVKWVLRILVPLFFWFELYAAARHDFPEPPPRTELPELFLAQLAIILVIFGIFPLARWFSLLNSPNLNVIFREGYLTWKGSWWSWPRHAISPDIDIQFKAERPALSSFDIRWVPWYRRWERDFRWIEMIHGSQIVPIGSMQRASAEQFANALQIVYDQALPRRHRG
jgi:hypothetical protein